MAVRSEAYKSQCSLYKYNACLYNCKMHFVQPPSVRPTSTLTIPVTAWCKICPSMSKTSTRGLWFSGFLKSQHHPAALQADRAAQPSQTPFRITTPARSHAQTHPACTATPQSGMGAISHAKCINVETDNANLPLSPENPNCQQLNGFLVLLTAQYSCLTESCKAWCRKICQRHPYLLIPHRFTLPAAQHASIATADSYSWTTQIGFLILLPKPKG